MGANYFYSEASIQWDLWDKRGAKNFLALTFGCNRCEDEIYTGSNSDDFSVKVSFKSYSLDRILNSRTVAPHDKTQQKSYRSYQQDTWLEMERRYLELQSDPEPAINQGHPIRYRRDISPRNLQLTQPYYRESGANPNAVEKTVKPAPPVSLQEESPQSTDSGQWFVSFGSYYNLFNAEELQRKLLPSIDDVTITSVSTEGGTLYRVRITGIETREKAEVLARQYEKATGLEETWVARS